MNNFVKRGKFSIIIDSKFEGFFVGNKFDYLNEPFIRLSFYLWGWDNWSLESF